MPYDQPRQKARARSLTEDGLNQPHQVRAEALMALAECDWAYQARINVDLFASSTPIQVFDEQEGVEELLDPD